MKIIPWPSLLLSKVLLDVLTGSAVLLENFSWCFWSPALTSTRASRLHGSEAPPWRLYLNSETVNKLMLSFSV